MDKILAGKKELPTIPAEQRFTILHRQLRVQAAVRFFELVVGLVEPGVPGVGGLFES
jgi:hypothetical protein